MKKKLKNQNFLKKFEQGVVQIESSSKNETKIFSGKILNLCIECLDLKVQIKDGEFYQIPIKNLSIFENPEEDIMVLYSFSEKMKMIFYPELK